MSAETIKHTNRLADEASPYLRQHADNPVDWYPWGDEAFEKARRLDRPIFLSVGYSTCHWCHVMAHESFSSRPIAEILNNHFVSIKVDREERPDVDAVYMNAVQIMTGSGGWPLSVFLTPEGRPFYGGTYYPPTDRMGRPGFDRVLSAIVDAWTDRREDLLESAWRMTRVLAGLEEPEGLEPLSSDIFDEAEAVFEQAFDSDYAGFGTAPKFPQAGILFFLMIRAARTGNARPMEMAVATLEAMARGGICDHLGGGFHRYSVDTQWLTPHFEKMLYDQALLSRAYLEAYQITRREDFARVARETMDYVLRDMTDAGGGYYSAEDADSQGHEGTFYLWTPDEIRERLAAEQAELFMRYYAVTEAGNFERGQTILSIGASLDEAARKQGITAEQARELLREARATLLEVRGRRPRPHRDEKIITGWNGLMIRALAMGGRILGDDRYTGAAQRAAQFVLSTLRTDGRLRRAYAGGQAVGLAFLEDYAYMIPALIYLYEADWDPMWLKEAKGLAEGMIGLFGDGGTAGLYQTGRDGEPLVVRSKPAYDGATPSGNSAAAEALLRMAQMTDDTRLWAFGEEILQAFSSRLAEAPTSLTDMLVALDWYLGPRREVVIAGNPQDEATKEMLRVAGRTFLPATVRLLHPEGTGAAKIEDVAPFVSAYEAADGRPRAFVCENYTCGRPIESISELKKSLGYVE